jgi:YD repeat-containing protein
VVTLTDEGTIAGGVSKRRQQRIYSDVFGRTVKTEILNWQGGSVYLTNVNTYNVRDQITNTKQYAGPQSPGNPYRETTAGYDGYGRLQSKHIPQESPGTGTTWTYNADDSVSTITDPRGAVSTFGYAGTNRGLVKTITHTLAGKPTINIAFNYDAAGNRTSMTDQTGTSNYYYNELSQLTSESRTLAGTQYTLSYQYHLGGRLKKMTYPGNISINYSYDGAGRLTAVTGSDTLYQGVSQYASGFSYRAWGARKTMTDGANRTSTTTYDVRLRPLTYQIDGGVVNQSYEYYNDSSMRFVHNVSDSNFDRLYEYDHAGRLAFATTGGAARGDSSAIPYQETFGYNAWGDTTSRFTETWSQDDFADAGSFTNGRRDGWGYEADGNIKTIDTRNYSYDAVGNRVLMTGQLWSGSNYFPTSTTNAYDGDGRRVEEVLSWPSPFTTRYLRSSVLGGEIAQEINSAGQTINYVYLPDGTQLSTLNGGVPKWRHEAPGGTGLYENYQSGFVNRVEFDPVGANVGLTAPPPPDTNGGDGDIGSNHNGGPTDSRYSDMANPAAGCYDVGGAILPCTWSIFDVLDLFVWTPARNPSAAAPTPDTPRRWVPPKRVVPVNIPNPFDKYLPDPVVPIDTTYTPGYWKYAPAPSVSVNYLQTRTAANPQKTQTPLSPKDIYSVYRSLKDIGKYFPLCSNFIKATLEKLKDLNPNNPPLSTDIVEIFRSIQNQPNGGFFISDESSSTVSGLIKQGNAKILYLSSPFIYVSRTIHEGFHISGSNGWLYDQAVAQAISQVDEGYLKAYEAIDPKDKGAYNLYSYLIDNALSQNCSESLFQR